MARMLILPMRMFATTDEEISPLKRKVETAPVTDVALPRPSKRARKITSETPTPVSDEVTKKSGQNRTEYICECGEFLCPDFDLHQPGSPISSPEKSTKDAPDVYEILSTPGQVVSGRPPPPTRSLLDAPADSPVASSVSISPAVAPERAPNDSSLVKEEAASAPEGPAGAGLVFGMEELRDVFGECCVLRFGGGGWFGGRCIRNGLPKCVCMDEARSANLRV